MAGLPTSDLDGSERIESHSDLPSVSAKTTHTFFSLHTPEIFQIHTPDRRLLVVCDQGAGLASLEILGRHLAAFF